MIRIIEGKLSDLNKERILSNLKRKRNYKCRVHDEIRDFFIKTLYIIEEGLEFVDKELRVVGGDIDIVAKKGQVFYLIEVKTSLSRYPTHTESQAYQLVRQMEGLNHIISMFTNKVVDTSLVIIEYVRDKERLMIKKIDKSRQVKGIREISLKVD